MKAKNIYQNWVNDCKDSRTFLNYTLFLYSSIILKLSYDTYYKVVCTDLSSNQYFAAHNYGKLGAPKLFYFNKNNPIFEIKTGYLNIHFIKICKNCYIAINDIRKNSNITITY